MKRLSVLLFALLLCACSSQPPIPTGGWTFAIMGDTPYDAREEALLGPMIGQMNNENLAFVVHVGDIISGRGNCSDAVLAQRKAVFAQFAHPFVLLPGDNDWTDCHRGGYDPLERLDKFRSLFHGDKDSLGGRTMPLVRQGDLDPRYKEYREHVRWQWNGVLFVGLNVQGSNNNLGRTAQMDAEYRRRMDATFEWLDEAVKKAERPEVSALVVMLQANPDFEGAWKRPPGVPDGFESLRKVLLTHALWLKKPLLFVHGDTHSFKVDRPLNDPASGKPLANFVRVEVDGSPRVGWARINVNPATPGLFIIRQEEAPRPQNQMN